MSHAHRPDSPTLPASVAAPARLAAALLAGARLRGVSLSLMLLAAAIVTAGCGGGDAEDDLPRYATRPPAPVSSSQVRSQAGQDDEDADAEAPEAEESTSDEASVSDGDSSSTDEEASSEVSAPATLPAEGDEAVIQLARVEPHPWEPALQAQMVPHFSLQANGRGFFTADGGQSEDGWYQTALTRGETERFLQRFVDEIGILDLAATRGEDPVRFETPPNGDAPLCPGSDQVAAVGVVYVKTSEREGRLVFSQCDLVAPSGPNAAQMLELQQVLNLVQLWKQGVYRDFDSQSITATRSLLGWWSDIQAPYTPDSVVAFGTRARGGIPTDAPTAAWPLEVPLAESFDADYGSTPVELRFTAPDSVALIREARASLGSTFGPRFWGPLWQEGASGRYLVGLRPSIPGGNHVVIDYEHVLPRRGIGVGR